MSYANVYAGLIVISLICYCVITLLFKLRLKWKERMLQFGAALLVMLGLFMVQNNLVLAGIALPGLRPASGGMLQQSTVDGDAQYITTYLKYNGCDGLEVKAGIPIVWTMIPDEGSLNSCNNSLVLPAFDQQIHLSEGETVVTFLPGKEGIYSYSCWMGMLKNTITVV